MMHIPVALSTDNNCIPLTAALISLAENAGRDTFYDIYILTDASFSRESAYAVEGSLSAYASRCSLAFIDVGSAFDDALISMPHITRPTYFRLMLPGLLSADRCIYLDTDVIVMADLKEMFDAPMDGCHIAGVWHPGVVLFEWEDAIRRNAEIPDAGQYVNAGVLVMDLKKLREDGMEEKFLELIPRNMASQDQDIINHACYGSIAFLPLKYNVIARLADIRIEDYRGCYPEAELREAWNNPAIIHYAGADKPWNSGNGAFMDLWWKYFRKSPAYGSLVSGFFSGFVESVIYHPREGGMFTKKLPAMFDMAYERKYAVYGAGKRAREVLSYMRQIGAVPECMIVSNPGQNPSSVDGIEVKGIADAGSTLHGRTVIIAVSECFHKEIIKLLDGYDCAELLPASDNFAECAKQQAGMRMAGCPAGA